MTVFGGLRPGRRFRPPLLTARWSVSSPSNLDAAIQELVDTGIQRCLLCHARTNWINVQNSPCLLAGIAQ